MRKGRRFRGGGGGSGAVEEGAAGGAGRRRAWRCFSGRGLGFGAGKGFWRLLVAFWGKALDGGGGRSAHEFVLRLAIPFSAKCVVVWSPCCVLVL